MDSITAFAHGTDLIDLADYDLAGIDDLTIVQEGTSTVISGYNGAGNTITLDNFQSGSLGTEDFIFDANANVIVGTLNNDVITPNGNSAGVTGDVPGDDPDIIKALGGNDIIDNRHMLRWARPNDGESAA